MTDMADAHGGDIMAAACRYGRDPASFTDFSANINPLGLPDTVFQAMSANLREVVHYPQPHAGRLKEALSRHYQVPVEWLTVGNGAVELLYIICHTVKPTRVLLCAPTFGEYQRAARAVGATVKYHRLSRERGFSYSAQEINAALNDVTVVFLANPNNPTGTLLHRAEMTAIAQAAAERGVVMVVDESFLDFLPNEGDFTCRRLIATYPNVVVVHSLTKFFAIPGLRLGFAVAAPEWTFRFHAAKDPWNVNLLAQVGGEAALSDEAYQQASRRFIQQEKEFLFNSLQNIRGLRPFPPTVNYILIDITATGYTAAALTARLGHVGVLVRDCSNFLGLSPYYIRVAVRNRPDNLKLLRALQKVLSGGCHDETDSGAARPNGLES